MGAVILACVLLASCGGGEAGTQAAPRPAARTVAFLRAVRTSQPENQAAFLDELAKAGYVKGENLTLRAESLDEIFPDAASSEAAVRQWVADGVDLIVALSTTGARAALTAAPETTVLFLVNDPVAGGLVADPRRPSGTATGVTFNVPADRTLDVTRRALPDATRFGIVYPPADPAALTVKNDAIAAAAALGASLVEGTFSGEEDAAAAVEAVRAGGAAAVWVLNSPTSIRHIQRLAEASSAAGLPVIANTTVAAAVVTLQPDTEELYRQIARQALRVFDGAPIAEIPVENPSKFVLEVNVPTAAALGISLPQSLIDRADKVIR